MTHFKVDAIEVVHAPMLLESALTPDVKLFGERLVQTTDGTSTGCDSHERLSDFSYFLGACPADKHLGQPVGHLLFIATIVVKELGVECSFTISGDLKVFDLTGGGCQIARVASVAIPFAFCTTLSPFCSQKLSQFFTHDFFHHETCCVTYLFTQMLMKGLLDQRLGYG